jgi:hypothetical protein
MREKYKVDVFHVALSKVGDKQKYDQHLILRG